MVQESLKVPARVWRAICEGFLHDDPAAGPGEVRAAALIVWGDADPFGPRRVQEDLLRAIARARLVVYPDAGHAMHWEQPARVAADLARFARSLPDPTMAPAPVAAAPAPV